MKRSKAVIKVAAFILPLILTGCGSKGNKTKLVCTQTVNNMTIMLNVDFEVNMIKNMAFTFDMDLSDFNNDQIKQMGEYDFCSVLKEQIPTYADAIKDCKQDISNKHLKASSILDIDKLATDEKDKMASIDEGKKAFEDIGYSCKKS